MKKTTFLLALMLILGGTVRAQVSAYSFAQTSGTYNEFTDGTQLAVATANGGVASIDDVVYPVDLPFDFNFNGINYISCNVSSNGFITFGATVPSNTLYVPISSTVAYDGAIAGFGGDINALFDINNLTGELSYKEIGTAPNRQFVIQYRNFRVAYTTSTTLAPYINFQIILNENSNVQVVYGPTGIAAGSTNTASTKQIGLRGATNADFNNRLNDIATPFVDNIAGTGNNSRQAYSSLNPVPGQPTEGLTYTWMPPTCIVPSGLTASNISLTGATISFSGSISNPTGGYELYYSTTSMPPAPGTTPNATIAAGSLTSDITGLMNATTYYVFIRSNCGGGDFSNFTQAFSFTTLCDSPSVAATVPNTICGQGTTTITATSNNTSAIFNWYADVTGGTSLFTGNPFTTPTITATTTYYAEASTVGSPATVGPESPTAQGGTIGTQTVAWNVNFTVLASTTLQSIDIFPINSGVNGVIQVRTSTGTVITTFPYVTNVAGGATAQTIPLDYNFAPGDYQLYPVLPTGGISRNITGATYPYTSAVANITANGFDQNYYMGFYNWKFATICASPRVAVTATVTTAPTLTLSSTSTSFCAGTMSELITIAAGSSDYQNFVFSPASGVTGNAADGFVFSPTASTMYTLTASQTGGSMCATTATVMVNITAPPVLNVSPSQSICGGTAATLEATTEVSAPGDAIIGTATTLSAATAQPTAFCNRFDQYWNQTVYTAAELTAAGMRAGNITSIAYEITTIGDAPNVTNFSIRIGSTTATTSPAFVQTGLDVVYGPSTYAQAIGVNVIAFDTPYNWDGVSNILVDVRQDGVDMINNSQTYYTATVDPMTRSAISSTPSATTPIQSTNPVGTTSLNRLNVVFGAQVASSGVGTLMYTWNPGNIVGNTIMVSPATTTTYTVTALNTQTGCSSMATTTVTVNAVDAPTGASMQTVSESNPADATIEDLVVVGGEITWYASAADAASGTNPLPAGTVLTDGATYYATQTIAGCSSLNSLAVTVTVTLGTTAFGLAGLDYYPNPTSGMLNISYSQRLSNVAIFNLIGQEVKNVQPDALKANVDMSSLPTGTYLVKVASEGKQAVIKIVKQ